MKTRIVVLGAALLACTPGLMLAAADPEVLLKQDIDRREQERREQRWDERHVPGGAPVLAPSPPVAASGPCFPVRRISVHPGDLLPTSRVAALRAAYEGRCLGAADLAAVQHSLNSLALDAGLVTTRVVVPEQNLASGELRLEVWPGILEAQEAPALSARELALASPLRPGDLLQLRALEQAVDNLNRLASLRSTIDLKPGEQPGGSVALLTVQRARPWQAALAWQGAALNGEETHTVRASATADSPLRLADRLVLGVNGNLQDGQVDDSHGGSLDYDLPVGWWRLSAGSDRYDYRNEVQAGLTTFAATGKSRAFRLEAARLLHRDATTRWTLALHGKRRLNDNFIA
ncbi:MAG: ShlB/FhaC/HecB family hemolysin secretion/activation protein [Pseudomonadota bacterium]